MNMRAKKGGAVISEAYKINVTEGNKEMLKKLAEEMNSQVAKFNEEARKAQASMQILRLQQQSVLQAILNANEAPKDMQFKLSEDFSTLTSISKEELEALAADTNNVLHKMTPESN